MKGKLLVLILVVLLIGIGVGYFIYQGDFDEREDKEEFSVDTVLLKASIKKSSSFDGKIKITNLKDYPIIVNAKLIDLENVAFLEKDRFELASGEIKTLNIDFLNSDNLNEDIYIGGVEFFSEKDSKMVPIILEVESDDVLFDSNIEFFPAARVFPGTRTNLDVKIFDLSQMGTVNVEVISFIKSLYGETIISESETVVVKDQISITKSFNIPENIPKGDYVCGVLIKYKDSVGTASTFFTIDKKELMKTSFDINNIVIFLILGFIIFILLIFVFYSVYSRDKLLIELRRQYRTELSKEDRYLKERERKVEAKLNTKEERAVSRKLFRKVSVRRRKAFREIERGRERKLKELKKAKKVPEMKRQISKWKGQGYNVSVFEKKARVPTEKDIKNQIMEWKKKGYKTKILEK